MAPNAKTLSPPPLHLSSSSSNTRSSSSRRIPGYSHHASPTSSLFAPCVIPGVTGRDFIPASPPIRSHLYSLRPITPARRQAIIKAEQPQYSDASMASVLAEPDVSTYSRRSLKRRRSEDELQPEAQLAPPPPRGPHPPLRPMVAVASPPRSPIRRSPIQLARERERSDSDQAELALLNLRNAMRSEQSSITVAPITTVRPRPRVAPAAPVAPSPAAPSTPALPVVTAVEAATTSTAAVPITVSDTGSASTTTATNSKRNARSHLFDAVVAANMPPNADNTSNTSSSNLNSSDCNIVFRRSITSPDDLERAELVHCFEVLHACGRATQPDAPVSSTRKSIEGFLDAVFKNWTPENWEAEGAKPKLEFTTEAEVVAGKICAHPSNHADIVSCIAAPDCTTDIFARIAYTHSPHFLKMDFYIPAASDPSDTAAKRPQILNPAERNDIRWITATDWAATLREDVHKRVVSRLHKHNKHLAIWQARKMIQRWARGGLPEGAVFTTDNNSGGGSESSRKKDGGENLGFFTSEGAKLAFSLIFMNSAH